MSIQGLSDTSALLPPVGQKQQKVQTDLLAAAPDSQSATAEFLKYAKMTPAERFEEQWLKSHNLTRAQVDAMPPEQREAVMNQMKKDIEEEIKKSAKAKGNYVDTVA